MIEEGERGGRGRFNIFNNHPLCIGYTCDQLPYIITIALDKRCRSILQNVKENTESYLTAKVIFTMRLLYKLYPFRNIST